MTREAADAIRAFRARGYSLIRDEYHPEHFGNTLVLLNKDAVNIRLVRDRGQWFAEAAFIGNPDEWFDSAVLFSELGEEAVAPTSSIDPVVKKLVETLSRWELLFSPEIYTEARQRLKEIQRKFAYEDFGYKPP